MALDGKRLEMMRQITKGLPAPKVSAVGNAVLFVLSDYRTNEVYGVFENEDYAWEISEELYCNFQIEADVKELCLNECLTLEGLRAQVEE